MKLLISFSLSALLVCFAACGNTENNKNIIGSWVGVDWKVNGNSSNLQADKTFFYFNDKNGYTFEYAGNKEEGTYKVENDMLFTKPTNQQEIMVKIKKLSNDTLVFDMNRSGQSEMLTLTRKK